MLGEYGQLVFGVYNSGTQTIETPDVYNDGQWHYVVATYDATNTSGPNLALYAEATRRYPQVAWQASGGIREARDLRALADCGVAAAISGKALIEERIPIGELGPFLPNA